MVFPINNCGWIPCPKMPAVHNKSMVVSHMTVPDSDTTGVHRQIHQNNSPRRIIVNIPDTKTDSVHDGHMSVTSNGFHNGRGLNLPNAVHNTPLVQRGGQNYWMDETQGLSDNPDDMISFPIPQIREVTRHSRPALIPVNKQRRNHHNHTKTEPEEYCNGYESIESMVSKDNNSNEPELIILPDAMPQITKGHQDFHLRQPLPFLPPISPEYAHTYDNPENLVNNVPHGTIVEQQSLTASPPEGNHSASNPDDPTRSRKSSALPPVTKHHGKKTGTKGHHHKKHKHRAEKGDASKSCATTAKLLEREPPPPKEDIQLGGRTISVDKNSVVLTTVIRYTLPPKSKPLTLYFEYAKNYLTHRYVLDQVKNQIHSVPNGYVSALQFQDCNVRRSTEGLLNRWLVTLSCPEARDQLIRMGIKLFNRKISLRRYDEATDTEYKEFSIWVKTVKKELDGEDTEDASTGAHRHIEEEEAEPNTS